MLAKKPPTKVPLASDSRAVTVALVDAVNPATTVREPTSMRARFWWVWLSHWEMLPPTMTPPPVESTARARTDPQENERSNASDEAL